MGQFAVKITPLPGSLPGANQHARTFGVVVALAIVLEPMADNGSIVKMNQHGRTPLRMSLRTDLAMKNAEHRGDM